VLATYELDRSGTPLVEAGAIVRRGDRLASVLRCPRGRDLQVGFEALRALLDARSVDGWMALVAPCDGVVESIEPRFVTLRTDDGRLRRLRIPIRRGSHVLVLAGDALRAGDPITNGERSHHALLHAWGEDRFAEHLIDELVQICGLAVPRVYWALAVRAMLGHRRIHDPGDTGLPPAAVVSREQLEQHQRATGARGGAPSSSRPVLQGFGTMASQRRPRRHREPPG
jgi:hypothetical protein